MIKKRLAIILSLMLLLNIANGQKLKKQFNELAYQNDTVGMRQVLEKWEEEESSDPELYIAYFNYYYLMSTQEVIALGQNPNGNNAIELINQDSSSNDPVAYLYGETYYNAELLNTSFYYISKGIETHPDRLDMRFGKVYLLGQLEDYENFTTDIIKTIEYSKLNENQWLWTDNEPLDDPEQFMLSTIQTYQLQLYNTEDDNLLENMKLIAEAVLTLYPNHIESLSNLSVVFMLQENFDKALEYLFKAEKLNPKDYIVLNNIAQAYKLKGDSKRAIKYYKRTIKYGDEKTKKYAQGQIEELK